MENKTLEELQDLEKRVSDLLNDVRLRIRLIELDKYRNELSGLQKELSDL